MQLAVTFRHMDATPSLKEYAKEKVERITKYFPDPIKAHVVLSCDRGYNHTADVMITLHNGIVIKGEESTEDMYSSIDLVMAKIERQVRRYKEKLRGHRAAPEETREMLHSVVSIPEQAAPAASDGEHVTARERAEDRAAAAEAARPRIIKKSKFFAQPLTVEEAVMQMNLLGNDFLVFTNAGSRDVNVVYRREDGTYGLIETGSTSAQS
jgi:putative sigma-54 modulation protein